MFYLLFGAEFIFDTVTAILLSTSGGLSSLLYAHSRKKKRLTKALIGSEIFIAAFCGLIALMFARAYGLIGDWLGVVCGLAGWTSPLIITAITGLVERLFGFKENELKK